MEPKNEFILPMKLQMFAEEGNAAEETPAEAVEPETQTEKAFTRSEIAKMLAAEKSKWEASVETRLKDAEARGKMTAEELAADDLKKERDKLEADRLALKRDQAEATTIKKLATDKLPDGLSVVLNPLYGGEEKDLDEAYTTVSKAFRDAVEQAVNIRLAGSADKPAGAGNVSGTETMATKMAKEANGRNESHDDLWSKK